MSKLHDVVIIGGGQSALSTAYFLKRKEVNFVILDNQKTPGGAWTQSWQSLKLFSPADYSSLPGWLLPRGKESYPTRDEILSYLAAYEERYELPIKRPYFVKAVTPSETGFSVKTQNEEFQTKVVVSATGTWSKPYIPTFPGQEKFRRTQLHSALYSSPAPFSGKKVMIVGGGNSGAQILAEIFDVATEVTWVTKEEPTFLPDDVDGRYLFSLATEQYRAQLEGRNPNVPEASLGDIVMVESVKRARDKDVLQSVRPFSELTETGAAWPDGTTKELDAIIWCTGFRPSLDHLQPLGVIDAKNRVSVHGTRSTQVPGLWLVGYGDWTGFGSATLIGVQRYARSTAEEITNYLKSL